MLKVRQGTIGAILPVGVESGTTQVIRHITPSAMQRRFTIEEETALIDHGPTKLKLARERMLNAEYVDLDLAEVSDGINAIVNFLATIPSEEDAEVMVVTDVDNRIAQLLTNGVTTEA